MFEYKKGNILLEQVDAIVNTVNCVGIMGRGIALQFKKSYPENFKEYEQACKNGLVKPGEMFIYSFNSLFQPKYVINFPTKRHWKGKSRIKDIENGLHALVEDIKRLEIKSIAIPPLGCGLGGLDWNEVKTLIEKILGQLDNLNVVVYEPNNENHEPINKSKEVPPLTLGRAALIGLINRYLDGLLDPFVTLLEIHKLMYFLQEAGQPLRLNYQKATYGPYAKNLRHVLNVLDGHYINGYSDGEDNPRKHITLLPGSSEDAQKLLQSDSDILNNFKKVSELVDGFETSFGLELLATVHWVVKKEKSNSIDKIINAIYSWNNKKRKFSEKQINIAYETLIKQGWLISEDGFMHS